MIKVMKNKGPKVEPCDTPESMGGNKEPELFFMFSGISADYSVSADSYPMVQNPFRVFSGPYIIRNNLIRVKIISLSLFSKFRSGKPRIRPGDPLR
jgi:hypothetical protein